MINFVNSWVQGIIIAVIISTIIEMILPDGNIKKYVRTVIGVYIVFVIISPIITKITGKKIDFSKYKLPEAKEYETVKLDTNTYIEDTYINKMKQDIIEKIESKGYSVKNVILEIDKSDENYGNINKIKITISKGKTKTSNIEPIEIDINSKPKTDENITKDEIQELKKFLKENYGTEDIYINE